ncbi:MAG TPA: hypothetical protein VMU05_04615 [Dongiaceae bacterium]|nr:hypothetical protein [Dongiaceae bacterium]
MPRKNGVIVWRDGLTVPDLKNSNLQTVNSATRSSRAAQVVSTLLAALFISASSSCGGGSSKTTLGTGAPPPPNLTPSAFFGMHVHDATTPFPAGYGISGVRLWDTQTAWATTNTSDGQYDWTNLDSRVNQATSNSVDVLYDFGRTPGWAQCSNSSPTCGSGDTTVVCAYTAEGGSGQCFPPNDLNVDGTGTNQHWINWVTAVVTRYKGQIKFYEIWNEPNNAINWQGTTAQLVRMTQDARCIISGTECNSSSTYSQKGIDTSAQILTPAFADHDLDTTLEAYLAAGGAKYSDVVAFHGYPGLNPPEQIQQIAAHVVGLAGVGSKPVFNTEGSWGVDVPITDPDQQAAFVSRYILVQQSAGVQKFYWYAWDGSGVNLWTSSGLNSAGVAFTQMVVWTTGVTITSRCTPSGTVWTCGYTRSGGYQAQAVWDTSRTCNAGSCSTSSFSPGSQFKQYLDVAGNKVTVNGSVPIGAKPILLETGDIP